MTARAWVNAMSAMAAHRSARRNRFPETREGPGRDEAVPPWGGVCRSQDERREHGHQREVEDRKAWEGRHEARARAGVEEALGQGPCAHRTTCETHDGNGEANENGPAPQAGREMSMQLGNQRANTRRQVGRDRGTQNP